MSFVTLIKFIVHLLLLHYVTCLRHFIENALYRKWCHYLPGPHFIINRQSLQKFQVMSTNLLQRMQNHIIIGTDSRGRGLKDFLAKATLFPQSHVHLGIFPGGNFSTVSSKVWNEVLSLQSLNDKIEIHAYVAAGICNLTKKIRHPNKSYEIFYNRNTENLDQLKQDITDFYTGSVHHNIYGKVVHIPPVSLAKCNANCNSLSSISSPALATQQLHLE